MNSKNDILKLPEFVLNPLQERLLALFPNKEGRINFRLFCRGLAVFHPDATPSAKLQCLLTRTHKLKVTKARESTRSWCFCWEWTVMFELYDVDGDGMVSVSDVEALLRMAAGENLTDEEVHELAVTGLADHEAVDFQDFAAVCPQTNAQAPAAPAEQHHSTNTNTTAVSVGERDHGEGVVFVQEADANQQGRPACLLIWADPGSLPRTVHTRTHTHAHKSQPNSQTPHGLHKACCLRGKKKKKKAKSKKSRAETERSRTLRPGLSLCCLAAPAKVNAA